MREIFQLIDSNRYDEALKISKNLFTTNRQITDEIFKIGLKILHKLITLKKLTDLDVVIIAGLFKIWFKQCIDHKQALVSKHTIIHYAVMFAKDLITKQLYADAFYFIEIIQSEYPFGCDDLNDVEGRKYLQYFLTVLHNEASSIISSKQHCYIEYSLKCLKEQIELNLKLNKNLNDDDTMILKIIEQLNTHQIHLFKLIMNTSDVKLYKLNEFYQSILTMFRDNVTDNCKVYLVLFNFYFSVVQPMSSSSATPSQAFTQGLNDAKKGLIEFYLSTPTSKFKYKPLLQTIIEYKNYLKCSKHSDLLKIEAKLVDLFKTSYNTVNSSNKIEILFLLNSIDFFFNETQQFINDSSFYSKYLKDCDSNLFLNLFTQLIKFYINLSYLVFNERNTDLLGFKFIKNNFYKILTTFYSIEKLFEFYFKSNNLTKLTNAQLNVDLCLNLLKNHFDYVNWLKLLNIFQNEELWRMYHNLENCCVKVCSFFFSIEPQIKNTDVIEYQKLCFNISLNKVNSQLKLPTANIDDVHVYKTATYIVDNLLLSLRMKHKYQEAIEIIKKFYQFLIDNNLEIKQYEILLLNWCKIKRDTSRLTADGSKTQTNNSGLDLKDQTIDSCIKINDFNLKIFYLYEELRLLKQFCSNDSTILLYNETYYVLERLYTLLIASKNSAVKDLDKVRLYIEMAQFCWLKPLCTIEFSPKMDELNSELCLDNATNLFSKHRCGASSVLTTSATMNSSSDIVLIDGNLNNKRITKKRTVTTTTIATNSTLSTSRCLCVKSKLLDFDLNLYKMLLKYAQQRDLMCKSLRDLTKKRLKLKETQANQNHEFDANFNQEQTSIQYLLCESVIKQTKSSSNVKQHDLIKLLDFALQKAKAIYSDSKLTENFVKNQEHYSLRKQFYSNLDLLAHLYGFFCLPLRKLTVLNIKYEILKQENLTIVEMLQIHIQTIINLMKSYLNLYKFDKLNELNCVLFDKNLDDYADLVKHNGVAKDLFSFIDKHKYMQQKTEYSLQYYLIVANYFLVKKNYSVAVYFIKQKILGSSVVNGRQTASHYEIKYYMKYLMFTLTTLNIDKSEKNDHILQSVNLNDETPLSLLEECYQAVFSVAKFYLQNSIEPSKVINSKSTPKAGHQTSSANDGEMAFFNVANAECFRILSDDLDIMQYLSKYYVELSRYREATCFIREGLDLTQLHNCDYRIIQFLLHQINTDLIANNYNDAFIRLETVESLLKFDELSDVEKICEEEDDDDDSLLMMNDEVDLMSIKNYMHLHLLKIIEFTKRNGQPLKQSGASTKLELAALTTQFESLNLTTTVQANTELFFTKIFKIRKYLLKTNFVNFYNDLFIELYLNLSNFKQNQQQQLKPYNSNELAVLDYLKVELLDNSKNFCVINEKWYLAQYYLLLFENSRNVNDLRIAYDIIKLNPHPQIYRRICESLFYATQDSSGSAKLKATYLLETQSIALRHKSCSIQIKNKRRSQIDLSLYDNLNRFISFNSNLNDFYDGTLNKKIPDGYTIIAFVLIDTVVSMSQQQQQQRNCEKDDHGSSPNLSSSSSILTTPKTTCTLSRRGAQRANKCYTDCVKITDSTTREKTSRAGKSRKNIIVMAPHDDSDIVEVLSDDDSIQAGSNDIQKQRLSKKFNEVAELINGRSSNRHGSTSGTSTKKIVFNTDSSPATPDLKTPQTKAKATSHTTTTTSNTEPETTQDLYLIRIEKNAEPFIQKLNYSSKYLKTFKEIITDNDASMKQSERTKFWQTRNQINQRLIEFLDELQDDVFNYAKILLLGSLYDKQSQLPGKIPRLLQDELNLLYEKLNLTTNIEQQKQILFYLLNAYESLDRRLIKTAFKFAKFSDKQLAVFMDYLSKNEINLKCLFLKFKRKHTCLLIDKYLHQIPWECLPILKQQSITRMPSIHFLLSHLQLSKLSINKNSTFYIVDPGGDLVHTKQKFQTFFEQQNNWEGVIGQAPGDGEFKKALTEYDLFIYTGHGSGSQYYPPEDLQKIRVRACSILMGCSSGNQYVMGDFEPYGTILAYILAGCPCVVGNLWDVTDRDIDRLTEEFLQSWLKSTPNDENDNICVHLNKARNACKMSHLNGSAPVIYGLPGYFSSN